MKSTDRFTQTVKNYLKFRPAYPKEVLELLISECHLTKDSVVADIGAGTGIFTKQLLSNGNVVYAVEPNKEMRQAAESELASFATFHSINGTAEVTTLPSQHIDVITAATAFHWFDAEKCKQEFKRILRPPGWVCLIWNVRNIKASPLLKAYEQLITTFGTDYAESAAKKFDNTVNKDFFLPYKSHTASFEYSQTFDWEGFKGRLLSTSYSLRPGDIGFHEMLLELRKIFDRYETNGKILFPYETKVIYGHLLADH